MVMMVQGTMPRFSSSEVQHCTALWPSARASSDWSVTTPSLAILIECGIRHAARADVCFDRAELCDDGVIVVFHAAERPSTSLRSSVSTDMPFASSNFSL